MPLAHRLALAAAAPASACAHRATATAPAPAELPFMNPDLPLERRVADIVGRLTLEEKAGQMGYTAPAIPRLGIPAYNWWTESLHGAIGAVPIGGRRAGRSVNDAALGIERHTHPAIRRAAVRPRLLRPGVVTEFSGMRDGVKRPAQRLAARLGVRPARRDELAKFLKERGVDTGIHYPVPKHLQPAIAERFRNLPSRPRTEQAVSEILSLPIHGQIAPQDVDYVSDCIIEFMRN